MPHLFDTEILGSKEQQAQTQLDQERTSAQGVVGLITEHFVIIPMEVQGIVPYGIGSVKIEKDGNMTFIAPSGKMFGRDLEKKFRAGEISAVRLEWVPTEEFLSKAREPESLCGDTSTTKDGEPCAFPMGHRFQAILYCASLGDMEADEARLSEDK